MRNSGPAQRADVAYLIAFQQTVNNSLQLGNQHVNLLSLDESEPARVPSNKGRQGVKALTP